MNVLLLDLHPTPLAAIRAALEEASGEVSIHGCRSTEEALALLDARVDLLVLAGDDGRQLLSAHTAVASRCRPPPTLVISAGTEVETAVALLKAGAEGYIVRDADGRWQTQLRKEAAALSTRSHAPSLRERFDNDLRQSGYRLGQIVDSCSVAMFVIDHRHRVTHWNRACEAMTGIAAGDIVGSCGQWRPFYKEPRPCMADLVIDGILDDEIIRYYGDKSCRRSPFLPGTYEAEDFFPNFGDGGRWLYFTAAPLHDASGQIIGAIETLIDITERKLAEELRQESEQRLAQIIDGSAVAAFVVDRSHSVTHWNRACAALTGVPAREVIGTRQQWRAFYPIERPCLADIVVDGANGQLARYYGDKRIHRSRIVEGGYEAQDFFPTFGNSGRWLYFTAAPLRNARGEVIGAIETLQDITEQKRAEESLRQSEERYRLLSITDGMTGLYNARHFAQRLGEEMDRCQRYQHPLALMVMDVDNFKQFNDTWGHVQGDQVLIRLAECITACLRRSDQAFRYGGEEFVVLLPETDMEEAAAAAERLCAMFASCDINPGAGDSVRCTASIGVTTFVAGESPRDFVARADSGTYEAKRQGKNRVIRIPPPAPIVI